MRPELVVIRGGGDLATGVAWRLHAAGFPIVVTELANPLTVRRGVALSSAVQQGEIVIEAQLTGRRCEIAEAVALARTGVVAVVVLPELEQLGAAVVVDARLAKRNLDTTINDAALVVGLGPGFTANVDCHAVVETNRGHHLGRVLWAGSAEADTGQPGEVGGRGAERVLRAAASGAVSWTVDIGDRVGDGQVLGYIATTVVRSPFAGIVRGLIASGTTVAAATKIGDVDPRADRAGCFQISDKALAIGGGVVEAVLVTFA